VVKKGSENFNDQLTKIIPMFKKTQTLRHVLGNGSPPLLAKFVGFFGFLDFFGELSKKNEEL
jgi:hypothetical protein